jgi:transcriptional regulator with XRE-family HTH domain
VFAIGSSLKDARLRKGLSLAETAEATKIRSRHLQALEDEQFDVLPGQTYVRGFLKTYADFLGLDGQLYVDEYSSRFWVNEDGTPSPRRKVRVRRKHHGRIEMNMIIFTVVAIVGVATLVIAAWKFGGASTTTQKPVVTAKPAAPRTVTHQPTATLTLKATTGSSLIDVHVLKSQNRVGRLLFHGTLERGQSQTFSDRALWVSVSTPRHVVVALNGSTPIALHGVCPRTVVATPQQFTTAVSCH